MTKTKRTASRLPRGSTRSKESYSRSKMAKGARLRRGGSVSTQNIYLTNKLSTEANQDSSYQQIGIIHFTEMSASNAVRRFATDLVNIFGKKGFEGEVYDKARSAGLEKLEGKLEASQKVCNLRIDFEHSVDTIIIHMYGSLYEKKKMPDQPDPSQESGQMGQMPGQMDQMGPMPGPMPGPIPGQMGPMTGQ